MDAFYPSVEMRDRPELRGRPVVVGGDPMGRGVVASASYEARAFGVRSAMSCSKAKRLCPQAVFVYPRFDAYQEASDRIRAIFHEVTPLVEPLSLDEAYLDVTENLLGEASAGKIALWIKKRIRQETGLTASAGVGPNKFIAKVASDFKKPDGWVVIPPEKVQAFIEKLSVDKIWGVGPVTAKRLRELGLRTAGDIQRASATEMEREFGKFGVFIHELTHGQDDRPVESGWDPKSRGAETTFDRDILDSAVLLEYVGRLSESVAAELREMNRTGRTITVKIRYKDFKTVTRSRTLFKSTDDARVIGATASELLYKDSEVGAVPVRLVGVAVTGLNDERVPEQLWLDLPGL